MTGAGLIVKNGNPVLEQVVLQNNLALSHGAGIYTKSNIKSLHYCLLKNNYSGKGNGAGLFLDNNGNTCVDATVFDRNTTKDTSSLQGGSAIYLGNGQLNLTNSVFTGNSTSSVNGTLFSVKGNFKITNCTFANNQTTNSVADISNGTGSTAEITNTILWNDNNKNEFLGDGFTVNNSCVTKGFTGSGNISLNPIFVNINLPAGADGKYGTADDGLRLTGTSPAIGISNSTFPLTDITGTYRIMNSSGKSDLGAYSFIPPSTSIQSSDAAFGYYNSVNEFVVPEEIRAFELFDSEWGYILAINSNRCLYARILVDNTDQTSDISSGPVTIYAKDSSGNELYSKRIMVERAKNGEMLRGKLVFYSKYPLLFLQGISAVNILDAKKPNDPIYFFYGAAGKVADFEIVAFTADYR